MLEKPVLKHRLLGCMQNQRRCLRQFARPSFAAKYVKGLLLSRKLSVGDLLLKLVVENLLHGCLCSGIPVVM
jgi:hypothetical protein